MSHEERNLTADVWIKISFSADIYGQDDVEVKIPKGEWYYVFSNLRLFSGVDMSQSKTGIIEMMDGTSVDYDVRVDLGSYRLNY